MLGIIPVLEKSELCSQAYPESGRVSHDSICPFLYLTGYGVYCPWLQLGCLGAHVTGSNSQSKVGTQRNCRELDLWEVGAGVLL